VTREPSIIVLLTQGVKRQPTGSATVTTYCGTSHARRPFCVSSVPHL